MNSPKQELKGCISLNKKKKKEKQIDPGVEADGKMLGGEVRKCSKPILGWMGGGEKKGGRRSEGFGNPRETK